jgi:hypothetical protein
VIGGSERLSHGKQYSTKSAFGVTPTYRSEGVLNEMSQRTFMTRDEAREAREKVLRQFHIEWDDPNYRKSLLNMLRPFLPNALLADVTAMAESLASA